MSIPDDRLANEIIARLNILIEDPEVRKDIDALIEARVEVSETTADHPLIQVSEGGRLGFLGLLNGIVGLIPEGSKAGWGFITAICDDDGKLVRFTRTV